MGAVSTLGHQLALTLSMTALVPGCGASDGLRRETVSGEVTLEGVPLRDGTLLLEPLSPESGTAVGAIIRNGQFAIARARGPVAGEYLARIYARSDVQSPARAGSSSHKPRPLIELIPDVYNTRSILRTRILRDDRNVIRYDLKTAEQPPAATGLDKP